MNDGKQEVKELENESSKVKESKLKGERRKRFSKSLKTNPYELPTILNKSTTSEGIHVTKRGVNHFIIKLHLDPKNTS